MVKNNLDKILQEISDIKWFCNIGKGTNPYSHKTIDNVDEAKTLWHEYQYMEANSIAWELLRKDIIKDRNLKSEWEKGFTIIQNRILESLKKSDPAIKICKTFGESIETFAPRLPFVGAYGEILLSKPKYFSEQIQIYLEGYLICGWDGNIKDLESEYPKSKFYIY